MKIKFVGAIDHITGSCSWLQHGETGVQFLVDCGMYQGYDSEMRNRKEFPFDPAELSFVLLTHAHLDHCGMIPKLYREGFTGKVYATAATAKLAEIGWRDAVKIGHAKKDEQYTERDVEKINFVKVDDREDFYWEKAISVSQDIWAVFRRSSHILGAAAISVSWKNGTENMAMCFSGDIGNNTKKLSYLPMMKPNKYPFPKTQYMLVESTYGKAVRAEEFKSAKNRQDALWQAIDNARAKGGKVLMPAFSIHRSQEILIDLIATLGTHAENGEGWKILCHSPMTAKVCQVYFEELMRTKKGRSESDVDHLYMSDGLLGYISGTVNAPEEPGQILQFLFETQKGGCANYKFMNAHKIQVCSNKPKDSDDYDIIIASSGMCEAGPICGYLEEYEQNPATTIVITGYQASAKGAEIRARATETKGTAQKGYAHVEDLSGYYSAHADQAVLLDYIFNVDGVNDDAKLQIPATVFINHGGNAESKNILKSAIEKQSEKKKRQRMIKSVMVAEKSDKWFDLNSGAFVEEEVTSADLMVEMRALRREVRTLTSIVENISQPARKPKP
ncbi:MAG: MBL fold metallo-hydrolase [Gammaproteobacteria bacterium]